MRKIVMSAGHGSKCQGAVSILNEVEEARRVMYQVAEYLKRLGVDITTYADDVSTEQDENLERICDFHNAQGPHDLDISIHFNAYLENGQTTDEPKGCEVFFVSEDELAVELSEAISKAGGLIDRGAKYSSGLYFLNHTEAPACLLEICFIDSHADVGLYQKNFSEICQAITVILAGPIDGEVPNVVRVGFSGTMSWFGGPEDTGVAPDEGLAFLYSYEDAPHLFLDEQPPGTTGLARRLDPDQHYLACRWDYDVTPKEMLADPRHQALVIARKNGKRAYAWPADWGPHEEKTGRAADLSPGLLAELDIETDDEVVVLYPARSPHAKTGV